MKTKILKHNAVATALAHAKANTSHRTWRHHGTPPKSGGALTTTQDGDAGCPEVVLRCPRTKASRSAASLTALVFGVGRRTSRSTPSSSRTNSIGTTSAYASAHSAFVLTSRLTTTKPRKASSASALFATRDDVTASSFSNKPSHKQQPGLVYTMNARPEGSAAVVSEEAPRATLPSLLLRLLARRALSSVHRRRCSLVDGAKVMRVSACAISDVPIPRVRRVRRRRRYRRRARAHARRARRGVALEPLSSRTRMGWRVAPFADSCARAYVRARG